MGIIKADFTNVESRVLIDEGVYAVKVKSAEETKTQNGDDMIKVTVQIINGEYKGETLIDYFPITEKALWKLKQFLEACGKKAEGKMSIDTAKLKGMSCKIDVKHEEYKGRDIARIGEYLSAKEEAEDDDFSSEGDDDWGDD